ncbi:hypothetical protein BC830DRAFT_199213 [Chytriomyces sp. MP71]|nr:hypothetical protein BC830DRAFT_199213 [Chytriomyces sp. MP71]
MFLDQAWHHPGCPLNSCGSASTTKYQHLSSRIIMKIPIVSIPKCRDIVQTIPFQPPPSVISPTDPSLTRSTARADTEKSATLRIRPRDNRMTPSGTCLTTITSSSTRRLCTPRPIATAIISTHTRGSLRRRDRRCVECGAGCKMAPFQWGTSRLR